MSSSTNMTSPQPPNPFSPDNSTFDFLQFMGIDSTNGTSPYSTEAGPSQPKESEDATRSGLPTRGRRQSRVGRHSRGARSGSNAQDNGMEVDTTGNNGTNGMVPYGPSQFLGLPKGFGGDMDMSFGGLGQSQGSIEFDANQAQLLQQQLEHIHMQSPLGFDFNNGQQYGNIGQSPFLPMAQMLLASPANGSSQLTLPNGLMSGSDDGSMDVQEIKRRLALMNNYGMITPAPSGEMFPQSRIDQMSPMHLEMLARTENDLNVTPMLSPALSNQHSMQPSPANHTAFTQSPAPNAKSPLELLQEQQRQFQEQLALLQQQQKELQATAAAVAAATSTSSSTGHSSYTPMNQNYRSNLNTNFSAPPSVGSINTPSPGYFSPLTSPALESTRNGQFAQHQYARPPHPLSALSSPALNPVGSSGGAQQTLSPALGPQSNADMSDPDYLRALIGSLDHSQDPSNQMHNQAYHSPAMSATHPFSPLVGATGTGPHRHSLPSKTRPSPMMKPINHRSHGKHGSTGGNFSLPTSPAIQRVVSQAVPGMGYLPPAAIQPHYASTAGTMTSQSALSISTPSTPSPVDLNQLMPPPPVPASSKPKGMAPMTPASLMNLGAGANSSLSDIAESGTTTPVVSGARRLGTRSAPSSMNAGKTAVKRNGAVGVKKATTGSRLAPNAAGKRALAMRPAGDVGVRAAVKGSAAAAALPLPEGETRKTSHKAAEQKRRDSLKAGFDELRLLLPPINTEALDPESGEPIPGSSAPRLLPKSSLVPDDNPNRGVSKVALLKFSNEYIVRLHDKVDKRDDYIERLRQEVQRLRVGGMAEEVRGPEEEDLLDMDMLDGEEDDFGDPNEDEEEGDEIEGDEGEEEDEEMEEEDEEWTTSRRKTGKKESLGRRPSLPKRSSSSTVKAR